MSSQPVEDPRTASQPWSPPEFPPTPLKRVFEDLGDRGPVFSVSETAKVFFARSPYWLRWLERDGYLSDDEGNLMVRREKGTRVYGLADIENITHLMFARNKISGIQLMMTMRVLTGIAGVWDLMEDDGKRLKKAEED